MLPLSSLLFSGLLVLQPPGGGFDDPELAPPPERSGAPVPGDFNANPFDEPTAEVQEDEDPFAAPDPLRDAPDAPMLADPPAGVLIGEDDLPSVREEAPLSLDPADPNVMEIVEPAATLIVDAVDEEANALRQLIENPYDIYDLREHAAVPANCLLARQACLPCTRSVTSCAACSGGTVTNTVPVQGVNPAAAEQIGQILLNRTPDDPRVQYLMFVLRYRENRFDEAFGFLQRAVELERVDPVGRYDSFMEPIQGRSRVYLERVRNLAGVAG